MAKTPIPKRLSGKQLEVLANAKREDLYVIYGSISEKWWILFSKCDKYLGGYDSKEDAEAVLNSGEYKKEDTLWYVGNSLVI